MCIRDSLNAHEGPAPRRAQLGPLEPTAPPVARALAAAPKTWVEKRSWVLVPFSFSRLYEWHVAVFQTLAMLAFAQAMAWPRAIAVQMLSTVLWTLNFLALARAAVEVCAGGAPERRSFDGAPSVGMTS